MRSQNKLSLVSVLFIVAVVVLPISAIADGAFDFVDPCKGIEKDFKSTTEALRSQTDKAIDKWDNMNSPPEEVRHIYLEAVKEAAFRAWSKSDEVKPLLEVVRQGSQSFDERAHFFEKIYPKVVKKEDEDKLVQTYFKLNYEANIRPVLIKNRLELENTIGQQQASLDENCKSDVFNQVFRSTFGRAAIIITGNLEAAKNEDGVVAQYYRATTGISITDIRKHGLAGGENSELRKAGRVVAPIFESLYELQKKIFPW